MRPSMFSLSLNTRTTIAALVAALSFGAASTTALPAQQPGSVKPAAQPAPKAGSTAAAVPKPGTPGAAATSSAAAVSKPVAQPPAAKAGTSVVARPQAAAAAAPDKGAMAAPQVDINHATIKELKTIPGIGDAFAARILKGRPYANKTQLVSRNIISASLFETIQSRIIAKQ